MQRGHQRQCSVDGKTYACFMVHKRSSHWISEDADVRRFFHDTTNWSEPLLPRCNADGVMCTTHNIRLERALALAWHHDDHGHVAKLVEGQRGLHKDNVSWTGRGDHLNARERHIPPSIQKAMAAAVAHGHIRHVMRECMVSEKTAWNYLATGSALADDPNTLDAMARMVEDIGVHYRALADTSGTLMQLVARLPPEIASMPFVMNKLRILRCAAHHES